MANFLKGVILQNSSRCSPLQPILTRKFWSGGSISQKSSHCSPFLQGDFGQGVNPQKCSHCSPTVFNILPPRPNYSHSYINLPPIDKSPTLTIKWEDFMKNIRPGHSKLSSELIIIFQRFFSIHFFCKE